MMHFTPDAKDARGYAAFRERQMTEEGMRATFDELREFCMSLGSDVIEDVRPHRVVFCKSMNMRWFADAKPADDSDVIVVKVRTGWRDPIQTLQIRRGDFAQDVRDTIASAYQKVR